MEHCITSDAPGRPTVSGDFRSWSRDGRHVYLREFASVDRGLMYGVFRYAYP